MVEQMRKGHSTKGNGEVGHMRKVGLSHASRLMELLEDDLLVWTMEGAPGSDAALERAKLAGLIAAGVLFAE